MRMAEQAVYRIDELTGAARERAFDWVRDDMYQLESSEILSMPAAIARELPMWHVTADDLNKAADKVGYCYAYDLVETLLKRHSYHGAKYCDYVERALEKLAGEKVEHIANYAWEYFPDDCVIEQANENDMEFTADGSLY